MKVRFVPAARSLAALLGAVLLCGSVPRGPPLPLPASDFHRRFVYFVTEPKTGRETLRVGQLYPTPPQRSFPGLAATAFQVLSLETISGANGGPGGTGPKTYGQLLPSSDNHYMAVAAVEQGLDFIDFWVSIWDLDTGTLVTAFTEQAFASTHRASCDSPKFDAWLAAQKAMGATDAQLAGYDYSLSLSGADEVNITSPILHWTAAGTLLVKFDLYFNAALSYHDIDSFEFEIPASGAAPLAPISCNIHPPPWADPNPPALSLAAANSAHPGRIRYLNLDLGFVSPNIRLTPKAYVSAEAVAATIGR